LLVELTWEELWWWRLLLGELSHQDVGICCRQWWQLLERLWNGGHHDELLLRWMKGRW
jgi:hypothetical protein